MSEFFGIETARMRVQKRFDPPVEPFPYILIY